MINELSDKISTWLQSILTPDKMEAARTSIEQFISSNVSRVVQHKLELYMGYLGLTKENLSEYINNPLPGVWNDTVGKAVEQLIKSLGG